jgi:hypothetical protein
MIAGAISMIAPASMGIVTSQFVPRSEGGIKATDVRKSMRTARMAKFRITIRTNIGISAGWRSGGFLATCSGTVFPVLVWCPSVG